MGPADMQIIPGNKFALTRRVLLGATLLCGLDASADHSTLPSAKSLHKELTLALRSGHPLLVLVSLNGCPFCKQVRENYLGPMRSGRGQPMVQIDMKSSASVQDFKDAAITHEKLVHAWEVTLAPTVLFFGRNGAEIAPRLVGFASPDYYGASLDRRLEQARAVMR